MRKKEKKSPKPTATATDPVRMCIVKLCGASEAKAFRNERHELACEILSNRAELAKLSGNKANSPITLAHGLVGDAEQLYPIKRNVAVGITEEHELVVDFATPQCCVIVLPRSQWSERIARTIASVAISVIDVRHALATASKHWTLVEYDEKVKKFRVSEVIPDIEESVNLRNRIVSQLLSNNEADFDIEIELIELQKKSRANRQRILHHMEQMSIPELQGSRATVYFRQGKRKRIVNIDKLATDFPQAYAACVEEKPGSPYLVVKAVGDEISIEEAEE